MKMKILLAAGVLLAMVPMASPKGKGAPAGEQLSMLCTAGACSGAATGLVVGRAYELEIVNNCTSATETQDFTADAATVSIGPLIPPAASTTVCITPNWNFYLFIFGRNSSQLKLVADDSLVVMQ
jgi:hypothetical protein